MKYFISQAMNGKNTELIKSERDEVIAAIKAMNPDAEIIDSFIEDAPADSRPLWFLGASFTI